MKLLRHRTPVGLSSRPHQRSHAELAKFFGVSPVQHRQRRSCRSTKTETITRAPPDAGQQQESQQSQNSSSGDHNEWQAQDNLVNLITALPMPSPQEMLDNSQPLTKPLVDVPEKVAETVRQTPGAALFLSASQGRRSARSQCCFGLGR